MKRQSPAEAADARDFLGGLADAVPALRVLVEDGDHVLAQPGVELVAGGELPGGARNVAVEKAASGAVVREAGHDIAENDTEPQESLQSKMPYRFVLSGFFVRN